MLSCASFDLSYYPILMSAYLLLCVGSNPSTSHAEAPSAQQNQVDHTDQLKTPPIKRLDQDRALVGDVLVNRRTKRIEVPAEVNMTRGILEYYGVGADGKLHESVLKINAVASHIHLALILAGYEPSEYSPRDPKTYKRTLIKRGSLLRLYIKWRPQGIDRDQWVPAEAWLYHREVDAPPKPSPYEFKGSVIDREGYAADNFKSIIGLIDDATVVLAPTVDTGNPYQGDQLGYEIYSSAIPPKGTPLTLVIQGASKKEIKEVAHYESELQALRELRRQQRIARNKLKPLPPPPTFELNLRLDARSKLSYAQVDQYTILINQTKTQSNH
jgi:hypothetical protein